MYHFKYSSRLLNSFLDLSSYLKVIYVSKEPYEICRLSLYKKTFYLRPPTFIPIYLVINFIAWSLVFHFYKYTNVHFDISLLASGRF